MAVATAMFRVANSVASVNTSDDDAPLTAPINQPARNDAATKVAASGTVSRRPRTKTAGSLATINRINPDDSGKAEGPEVRL